MSTTFLSTGELAEKMGISRIAVFKKIKKGEIKAEKVGRAYVIDTRLVPGLTGKQLNQESKAAIDLAVAKTVQEYGETLRLLGKE